MKLYKIVRKVAHDLMPVGTVIERMRNHSFLEIGEKITVDRNGFGLINIIYNPENFRVVKEAE